MFQNQLANSPSQRVYCEARGTRHTIKQNKSEITTLHPSHAHTKHKRLLFAIKPRTDGEFKQLVPPGVSAISCAGALCWGYHGRTQNRDQLKRQDHESNATSINSPPNRTEERHSRIPLLSPSPLLLWDQTSPQEILGGRTPQTPRLQQGPGAAEKTTRNTPK